MATAGQSRREEFLSNLEEIFQKEGFRKVTIGELASRLRCSRRSLYELAPSKEGLFLLMLDRLLARIRERGDEGARGAQDPGVQLEAFLRPGFEETLHARTAFFDDIESFPGARRVLEDHQSYRIEAIRKIIQRGVRKGQLRPVDARLVSEVARVVARRLKDPDFLRETSLSAGEAFAEWTALLLHGLLHPTAAERRRLRAKRR